MMRTHVRTPLASLLVATAVALVAAACGSDDDGTGPISQTGTINGAVTVGSAGVPGASVALSTGASQTTSAAGQYTFANVAAGTHTLTVTLPTGFELDAGQTAARQISVAAGATVSVNWSARQQAPQTQVDTVRMVGTAFQPAQLTVAPGRTVVWVNTQSIFHTVTPDGHSAFNRATTSAPEEVLRVTFNTAGSFAYFCEPHRGAGMTGTITVQ